MDKQIRKDISTLYGIYKLNCERDNVQPLKFYKWVKKNFYFIQLL